MGTILKRFTYPLVVFVLATLFTTPSCEKVSYEQESRGQVTDTLSVMYSWLGRPYEDVEKECRQYNWSSSEYLIDTVLGREVRSFAMPHYYPLDEEFKQDFMVRVYSDDRAANVERVVFSKVHESDLVFDNTDLNFYYDIYRITGASSLRVKIKGEVTLEDDNGSPFEVPPFRVGYNDAANPYGLDYDQGQVAINGIKANLEELGGRSAILYASLNVTFLFPDNWEEFKLNPKSPAKHVYFSKIFEKAHDGVPGRQTTVIEMVAK